MLDWAALSMMTQVPKPTGNVAIDEWNHAISCVQSFLNGKAVAAVDDDEREYLLRLRADLNAMHLSAPADDGAATPTPIA